jgi:hypothetical protein
LCAYAQAVNWPRLYAAAGPVVALTDAAYLARLKQVVEALEAKKPREAVLYEKQTDWGRIVFAGSVENRHEITDQAVIVDLGGNDTYVLGGDAEPPVLIIDFSGDDTYRAERDLGFACGRLGASVLVDVEGNDTYETAGYALGFGLFGVGILADYAGDDTYTSEGGFVQGASAFGVGLLVEGGGRDTYKAHVYAQGFALCGGPRGQRPLPRVPVRHRRRHPYGQRGAARRGGQRRVRAAFRRGHRVRSRPLDRACV